MKHHPQKARVFHARCRLGEVIEQRHVQLFVLCCVAIGRNIAGAKRLQRQRGNLLCLQAIGQVRHIKATAGSAGKDAHVVIRAARHDFGFRGINAELRGIQAVLVCKMPHLRRRQGLNPVEGEYALPQVPLRVQHFKVPEQHCHLLVHREINLTLVLVVIERVRDDDRDVTFCGVTHELVHVVPLAVQDILILPGEAVGQHVDEQVVFREPAGELCGWQDIVTLFNQ